MARRHRHAPVARILAAGAAMTTFGILVTAIAEAAPATPATVRAPRPVIVVPREHRIVIEVHHHPAPVAAAPPVPSAAASSTPATRVARPAVTSPAPVSAPTPSPPPTVRVAPPAAAPVTSTRAS